MERDYNVFVKMVVAPKFNFSELNELAYHQSKERFIAQLEKFVRDSFEDYLDEDYELNIDFREHKIALSFALVMNDESEDGAKSFGEYLVKDAIPNMNEFVVVKYDLSVIESDMSWLDELEGL